MPELAEKFIAGGESGTVRKAPRQSLRLQIILILDHIKKADKEPIRSLSY
jgi:hypothetical protein